MRMSKYFFVLLALFLLLGMMACDKDQATSPGDPTKAADRVTQANQILVPRLALIINSGGTDTTAFDMSAAHALYAEALEYDPTNRQAHFGIAITGMMGMFTDAELMTLFASRAAVLTPSLALGIFKQGENPAHLLSALNEGSRGRLRSIVNQTGLFKTGLPFTGSAQDVPPSVYQNIIETKLLPRLTDAIGHLQQVVVDPTFVFLITPDLLGGITTDTYRIDLTEVYLMLAVLQGLKGEASFAVSYNIDYDPTDSLLVSQAWQVGSPFLGLRTNGAQRMSDTKSNFSGMATSLESGIIFLKSEPPHAEIDIIQLRPEDVGALDSVLLALDTLQLVLAGPYAMPDGPTVDFASFFDTPVTNFKAMMPAYSVIAVQGINGYDAQVTWQATTFETWIFLDPTFNGFLPGMTDPMLKEMLGLTALDWQQTFLIEG